MRGFGSLLCPPFRHRPGGGFAPFVWRYSPFGSALEGGSQWSVLDKKTQKNYCFCIQTAQVKVAEIVAGRARFRNRADKKYRNSWSRPDSWGARRCVLRIFYLAVLFCLVAFQHHTRPNTLPCTVLPLELSRPISFDLELLRTARLRSWVPAACPIPFHTQFGHWFTCSSLSSHL